MLSARSDGQLKNGYPKIAHVFPHFAKERRRGGVGFGYEGEERGEMGTKGRGLGRGALSHST